LPSPQNPHHPGGELSVGRRLAGDLCLDPRQLFQRLLPLFFQRGEILCRWASGFDNGSPARIRSSLPGTEDPPAQA